GRIKLKLRDLAVAQLEDPRPGHSAELIEPVLSVENERAVVAEVTEDANHQGRQPRCPDAKGLALHMRRVCQRTEDVKNRPDPELTPRRARVPHRRMERGREAKSHARLHDTAAHPLWPEHDVNAERLTPFGASTAAGRGPAPKPGDIHAADPRRDRP